LWTFHWIIGLFWIIEDLVLGNMRNPRKYEKLAKEGFGNRRINFSFSLFELQKSSIWQRAASGGLGGLK
jgi:hypothetical protein